MLSEMFGVGQDTDFGVKGYSAIFKITMFLDKYEYLQYKWAAGLDWKEAEGTMLCSIIGGAPANIIHLPPPLTNAQREQLKALYTLGYRWLSKDRDGSVYASRTKPYKVDYADNWAGRFGVPYPCCSEFSACLASLVSWSNPEPYDIGKALEVER